VRDKKAKSPAERKKGGFLQGWALSKVPGPLIIGGLEPITGGLGAWIVHPSMRFGFVPAHGKYGAFCERVCKMPIRG